MIETIIAWALRLTGVASPAAAKIAAFVAWLLSFLREKKDEGVINPHLKRTTEEEKLEAERGNLPADNNHDFPNTMN